MDIKKVIILIIVAFTAGYFVWAQCQKPLNITPLSVTKPAQQPSPDQELEAIDIGNLDEEFKSLDAELSIL